MLDIRVMNCYYNNTNKPKGKKGYKMNTNQILKKFLNLNDRQKLEVIRKLEQNKELPFEISEGLNYLYQMSKHETKKAMFEYIDKTLSK